MMIFERFSPHAYRKMFQGKTISLEITNCVIVKIITENKMLIKT